MAQHTNTTDAGMVLILLMNNAEPLGRKMEVSKLFSAASGRAIESVDGEAWRMDDSYNRSLTDAHLRMMGGGASDAEDDCVSVVGMSTDVAVRSVLLNQLERVAAATGAMTVDGGSVDAVLAESMANDVGVTTEVVPSEDSGSVDNRLRLNPSEDSASSQRLVSVGVGMWNNVGVCAQSSSSRDKSNGEGVAESDSSLGSEGREGEDTEGTISVGVKLRGIAGAGSEGESSTISGNGGRGGDDCAREGACTGLGVADGNNGDNVADLAATDAG